eukprot:CAMPEP_0172766478 /NCGR_PEP_ID=MMETSP1074-20121228/181309_1 /TAXON_ID=2916 /ORGANISM="Ceratium fusus, Strain PA161109" /LENGTH=44 /DNA_ID= /DNA_START= /DNA_END= /DNA_ORIENTATION=
MFLLRRLCLHSKNSATDDAAGSTIVAAPAMAVVAAAKAATIAAV